MEARIVVGLYESRGTAEDAINRLRTEGIPAREIALRLLRETGPVPTVVKAELAGLSVDPMLWGDVRDTYVSYIHNGETVVIVRTATAEEAVLAADVLRLFAPLVVDVREPGQTAPASLSRAASSAE